ncbi:MAG TPA: type II secretion system F family protein [Candidatus Wallbacteria bacterium]|nr:type II secretion system F family protein [Candidatus Wallbacteria bacterium]
MPIFEYKAKNNENIIVDDVIYAVSKAAAIADLSKQDLDVISIDVKGEGTFISEMMLWTTISLSDLAKFTRYFSVLIKGNVNLLEALGILEAESKNRLLKKIIRDVCQQVEGGKPLHVAFSAHKKHVPKIFIDLVRVGELSGKLYECFMRITDYLEKTIEFRRKLRDALSYPVFLLVFIFVLVTYVVTLLIPRFEEIYKSMGGELPMPTQILLAVGHFSRTYFWMILGAIFILITIYIEINSTRTGKKIIDRLMMKAPIMGLLIIQYNFTQFIKSLNMLFFSGYTFLNSLKESAATVENLALMDELNTVCTSIENGVSIYDSFKKSKYLPTFTVSMLRVGEKSNTLYEMLETIVAFNERELDYATTTFLRIMEPLIIVALAFVVGLVLFAAYLPVLSMSRLIKV